MKDTTQSAWSSAAKEGLILALFTIVFLVLTALIKQTVVVTIIDVLKIIGCIWVLRYFMLKWNAKQSGISIFKYGVMICLFSSIVCAIFTFFEFAYIFPDLVEETFDKLYESLGTVALPSESMSMIEKIEDNYPQWMCISALISDFLIGLIFSAIISSANKGKENIFEENEVSDTNETEIQ